MWPGSNYDYGNDLKAPACIHVFLFITSLFRYFSWNPFHLFKPIQSLAHDAFHSLCSIQKWCLRLTENFSPAITTSFPFQVQQRFSHRPCSTGIEGVWDLARKGIALLKNRPGFFLEGGWFTVIQVLPPICSLCSRQPAEVNGAFPSLPLSFGTRRSYWSGGSLNAKSKELCVLQQPWYSPIQRDLPLPPLIWPHWRVSTDAWHIHSQGSRQPRLLAGCCLLMIQSWATAWVIVSGMVGKRLWQDQREKMLRVGCLQSRVHRKG